MKLSSNAIIKQHDAVGRTKKIDVFFSAERAIETGDPRERELARIETMKNEAREEAARIINEAKTQAVCELESGFEEGIRRGLEKMKPLEALLEHVLAEVKHFQETYPVQLEPEMVSLVMHACSKILKTSMETDREVIVRTVRDAFKELTDKEYIKLRVHKDDFATVKEYQPRLLDMFHAIRNLDIVVDETVDVGGCIIETREGIIDATIRTQLKKMYGLLAHESFAAHKPVQS